MTNAISIIMLGLFLGMRHATDPDHVVAVTTIVARERKFSAAALIGALWGLGHTITVFIVGGGIIVFEWVIPARVGLSMEFAVGVMLVLLGLLAFRSPHVHGEDEQPHDHLPRWLGVEMSKSVVLQRLRPLLVGLVHGLAGSAGVALLVLTTIQDPKWAMAYLLIFGLGTLIGMALITMLIAVPFRSGEAVSPRVHRALRLGTGVLSVAFGLFVMYQMGIGHHLFAGIPTWEPK